MVYIFTAGVSVSPLFLLTTVSNAVLIQSKEFQHSVKPCRTQCQSLPSRPAGGHTCYTLPEVKVRTQSSMMSDHNAVLKRCKFSSVVISQSSRRFIQSHVVRVTPPVSSLFWHRWFSTDWLVSNKGVKRILSRNQSWAAFQGKRGISSMFVKGFDMSSFSWWQLASFQ